MRGGETSITLHAVPRRFLIAPDKFKGSLTAPEAAAAMAAGILQREPDAELDL